MGGTHATARARRSAGDPPPADIRNRLLTAMTTLLADRRFADISVADILRTAGVSRASFYFYFPSRQAVLAELVRQAVSEGHQAARPWTGAEQDPLLSLRAGVTSGATLWQKNAGVLKAIVECWGSDDDLHRLWLEQMDSFTDAAVRRIQADPAAMQHLDGRDVPAVAASLTWLGERLYYLAAAGVPPFTDQSVLVETLTNAWTTTLYGSRPPG